MPAKKCVKKTSKININRSKVGNSILKNIYIFHCFIAFLLFFIRISITSSKRYIAHLKLWKWDRSAYSY